jgi:hypothetical protein
MLVAKAREELLLRSLGEKEARLFVCGLASKDYDRAVNVCTAFDQFKGHSRQPRNLEALSVSLLNELKTDRGDSPFDRNCGPAF